MRTSAVAFVSRMLVRLVAASVTGLGIATPLAAQTGLLRAKALRAEAESSYAAGRYGEAADRFADAARTGVRSAGLLYEAAMASAHARRPDQAFRSLRLAVAAGMTDDFSADSDLVSLHDDQRWPDLLRYTAHARARYRAAHANPAS